MFANRLFASAVGLILFLAAAPPSFLADVAVVTKILDAQAIVQAVNQIHPGRARYLEIDGMAHDFTVHDKFYDPIIGAILNWIKEQLATK